MGIYIKGMEMPTSCRACLYSRTDIRNVDWCVLTEKDLPCDCPLVSVPPHGRLIDAGKLRELYEEWENDKEAGIDIDKCHVPIPVIRQNIDDAPTIILAEEGEHG